MNDLTVFNNPEFGEIRTVTQDEGIWFVGKDITDKLGYRNGSRDINRHVFDEDRKEIAIHNGTQNRNMICVNESGVYALIFGSELESAKRFKHWVTSEVLPSIRKTGSYTAHQETCASEQLDSALALQVAKVLSHAPADRLPMIADVFKQAGINIDLVNPLQEPEKKSGRIQNLEEFLEGLEELAEFSHGEYRVLTNVFNDYCEERGESSRMARKMLAEKGLLRISVTSDGRQHYTISMRIPGENRVTRCVCIKPGWREYLE